MELVSAEPTFAEPADRELSGVQAGAILFVGVALANVGNYIFTSSRREASDRALTGTWRVLTALAGLIALPLGGMQIFTAQRVAAHAAHGAGSDLRTFARSSMNASALAGFAITALLVVLSPLISNALSIDRVAAVVLTGSSRRLPFLTPVALGVAQGVQRFTLVAVGFAVPPLLRTAFAAAFLAAGLGVTGAMGATLLAGTIGLAIPVVMLRGHVIGRPRGERIRQVWSASPRTSPGDRRPAGRHDHEYG